MSTPGTSPKKRGPGRPRKVTRPLSKPVVHIAKEPELKRDKKATVTRSLAQADKNQNAVGKNVTNMVPGCLDVGGERTRWQELKKQENVETDEEFTKLLLDLWFVLPFFFLANFKVHITIIDGRKLQN